MTHETPATPTLLQSLLHWERSRPDTIYLTQPLADGTVVDYRWSEVADQVRRAAGYLRSLDLPPGSSIALLGKNSAHWIMADLAVALAGHVSVPIYPSLNADTARYIFEHSEARLLFLGRIDEGAGWTELRDALPPSLPVVALPLAPSGRGLPWQETVMAAAPLQDAVLPQAGTLATILYTSGSTGRPKGVMHAHGAMARGAAALRELLAVGPDDRLLSYLPLAHVAERLAVEAVSLSAGCRVYFSDCLETFTQDLQRARPTVFFSVPRLWTKFYLGVRAKLPEPAQALLAAGGAQADPVRQAVLAQLGLQHTRVAMTGSAPLPQAIIDWYRSLGLDLLELYGMSENLAYSHAARPGQTRPGYVGHAMPGVEARIAEDGELQVKSPCQMMGYYKQPEKSADETTADGYFRTGDRGELDEEGRVRITGRTKELFKTSKGKYVAPVPIENRLGAHPRVESVCVAGAGHPQPCALLMLTPEARQSLAADTARAGLVAELETLIEHVNTQLEAHEKLDCLVIVREPWTVENGLLTPTLKIRRNLIEERHLGRAEDWARSGGRIVWEE
ncbi:AMP-binding acetyl-CoA synthetase [Solimonas sp. K1W22B-7]|uniref:AMP-binding protein n=1 Tax=Solimonas sp. K1W22B-7 TaxID=2303331 RepID=UPI000E32F415|nr:AMP-binding protein [Solimonas sp. K1W22B-7]AXQ31843.1 AMP-binding acetyl-CoA synthetase [Solimonas sp. K1W22B-7]